MKHVFLALFTTLFFVGCSDPVADSLPAEQSTSAQSKDKENADIRQALLKLSQDKWNWMAKKNLDELANIFDERSKFVHMSGTWNKPNELQIIESGSIWYKKADVHNSVVELFGDTAIVWSRITLEADVRGSVVSNEFTVTEVYQNQSEQWKLLNLAFSSVRDDHSITH